MRCQFLRCFHAPTELENAKVMSACGRALMPGAGGAASEVYLAFVVDTRIVGE
jgi:hypothetical protein